MKSSGGNWKNITKYLLVILVAFAAIFGVSHSKTISSFAKKFFAAGQVPAHSKIVTDNHDGTHQIELTVTGDADTEVETAANVNVIIVYDHSSSMTNNVSGGRNSRADQAEDVVYSFVNNLFGYQDEANPNNIQMALVTFARSASVVEGWTSNERTIRDHFDQGGTDGRTVQNYSSSNNANNGTNWDAALGAANDLLNGTNGQTAADGDPTFVILVTDGAPTASGNGNNAINPSGASLNDLLPFYRAARNNARSIQSRDNTTLFGIYAYGTEADLLDDLMYYSNTGSDRASITAASVSTDNYYNAGNTDSLNQAITEIFGKIVEALGISAVSIDDGTTNGVEIASNAPLLNVDESSYKYWLQVPIDPNTKQFQRVDLVSGDTITYTVQDIGDGQLKVTWNGGEETVKGTIDPTTGSFFKYQWTEANSLYDKAPPAAKLEDGSVKWDLNSVGTLLDGVTYSVTFDVYPSQDTYDFIAEIKNIDDVRDRRVKYNDLDSDVKDYLKPTSILLDQNGYFDFTLSTNTEATLSYTDTRTGQSNTTSFEPQDPVATTAERMKITKTWENDLDYKTEKATVNVKQDGEPYLSNIELTNETPDVTNVEEFFIATGLMKVNKDTGEISILDHGYDYTFSESGADDYNWELVSETVRPMIINGQLTKLVKLDENATKIYTEDGEPKYTKPESMDSNYLAEEGKEYYKINGEIYVAVPDTGLATLSATNYRRSNLNITKEIDGVGAPATDAFTYKLTIKDAGATDDLWFAIQNADGTTYDTSQTIANTTVSGNYYVLPKEIVLEGTELTFTLNAGDNIRFINLTTKTEYTVEETTMPDVYKFEEATVEYKYGSNDSVEDEDAKINGKVVEGTIGLTNSVYEVKYVNEYQRTRVIVTKDWQKDNGGAEGLRVPVEVQLKADGQPQGDPVELNKDNDWTYTWTELYKYSNEQTIEYTVEELTDLNPQYEYTETTGSIEEGFVIVNTRNKDDIYTTISGTKTWKDAGNENKRPESIEITLLKPGENGTVQVASQTVEPDEDGNWNYTFTEDSEHNPLPKYENGKEIKYSIGEIEVTGYSTSVNGYNVINTLSGKINITGIKDWQDGNNRDHSRPNALILVLVVNNQRTNDKQTVNYDNNWTCTWENRNKYDENGVEIQYSVEEETLPAGYTGGATTYDEKRDAYVITNYHTVDPTSVKVTKEWKDKENIYNTRTDSVTVSLKANGDDAKLENPDITSTVTLSEDNEWEYTWTDLVKNKDGSPIDYTVVENEVSGYSTDYETTNDGKNININIVNTLKEQEIKVTKIWEDDNNRDGLRPLETGLDVTITGRIGEEVVVGPKKITLTNNGTNTWSGKWDKLPVYINGEEVIYNVEESLPTGFNKNDVEVTQVDDGFVITNKHEPTKIKISGTKEWDDHNNIDEIQPEVITLILYGNGQELKTIKVGEDGNWSFNFNDLYKNENGQPIKYEIKEKRVDGYETEDVVIPVDDSITYDITVLNTHTPKISYTVSKSWDDSNNNDGLRPNSITVRLLANGQEKEVKQISAANGWTYTFKDLDRFDSDGVLIQYTIIEDQVKDYEAPKIESGTIEETTQEVSATITNKHDPIPYNNTGKIKVEKIWKDRDNKFNTRPSSITIHLFADGVEIKKAVLTADNNWTYTFEGLNKFNKGKEIVYTVTEDAVKGYNSSIDGFKITNTMETKAEIVPPKTGVESNNSSDNTLFYVIAIILTTLGVTTITFRHE